jgi:hypothetical protein
MNLGEKILVGLIAVVFFTGVYLGVRLYLWNRRDLRRKRESKKQEN